VVGRFKIQDNHIERCKSVKLVEDGLEFHA
jgi:hypothetical protein